MNVSRLVILGVSILAGIAAFVLMMTGNKPAPGPIQIVERNTVKTVRVLTAKKSFGRGERIDPEKLKWVDWPENAVAETFLTDKTTPEMESLSGSVVRIAIVEGEPMTEAKIVRAGNSGLMAAVLSPGMRAVTMRVTPETASGGFILPGDRVDILYSQNDDRTEQTRTRTFLQNVRVLAVNTIYSEQTETPFIEGNNVTIELAPADAEYFVSAQNSRGTLSFALRSIFEPEEQIEIDRRDTDVQVIRYGRS
ncbi:MAG: Flp pilus assembly protein CpaB [Pseudomonadota bacterium]